MGLQEKLVVVEVVVVLVVEMVEVEVKQQIYFLICDKQMPLVWPVLGDHSIITKLWQTKQSSTGSATDNNIMLTTIKTIIRAMCKVFKAEKYNN